MTASDIALQSRPTILAVGGVQPIDHSDLLKPGITFATLFFTEEGKLITDDLHEDLR